MSFGLRCFFNVPWEGLYFNEKSFLSVKSRKLFNVLSVTGVLVVGFHSC